MITIYLKNGLVIEVDDALESVSHTIGGELAGMKWRTTIKGKRALQHISLGEVVAIVDTEENKNG